MAEFFSEVFPRGATCFWILMTAVDLLRNQVSNDAANGNVRREMVAGTDARKTHCGSETVAEELGERAGVFMREDSRDGKSRRHMLRREGRAALEEAATAVVLEGARPLGHVLQYLDDDEAIQRSFTSQETSFHAVIVLFDLPPQIEAASRANQRSHTGVRNRCVPMERLRILAEMRAKLAVGDEESRRQTTYGDKPRGIGKAHSPRAGPKLFLVTYKVPSEPGGVLVCARRCYLRGFVHRLRILFLSLFLFLRKDLTTRLAVAPVKLRRM